MTEQDAGQGKPGSSKFLATTLIGGVAVLLPLYLAVILVAKMLQGVSKLFAPLIGLVTSVVPIDHPALEWVIGFGILIGICFLCGLAIRTSVGTLMRSRVKPKLEKLPGYTLLTTLTQQFTGLGKKEDLQVVAVALGGLDEALSIGFLIDHQPGKGYVVFVPSVPTPASGDLFMVGEDKVFPLDLPFMTAVKFFSQWGMGSAAIMQAMPRREELGLV
jgi:uncharacterized membrane protein